MRWTVLLAAASLALGANGACADSNDDPGSPVDGGNEIVPKDGGNDPSDGAADDAEAGLEMCSRAGWCLTPLPDADLTFKDIWPLPGHAFALATSLTLGAKVLEWVEATGRWTYIDDSTQNEAGFSKDLGKIWAPSENEVYYGVSPGIIYHGVRPAPPRTEWSWSRVRLPDHSRLPGRPDPGSFGGRNGPSGYALGVWGTGPSNVYAWYANAIFRWKSEGGGSPSWVLEYAARDVPETNQDLYFLSAAGTSADDVWFGGARPGSNRSCAFVVNKVAGEYKRAADGVLTPSATDWFATCVPPSGVPSIDGAPGWADDIHSPAPGLAFVVKGGEDIARLSRTGDGYAVSLSHVPWSGQSYMQRLLSLWAASDEEQWISGKGIIFRANDVWNGGAYEISTLEMRGAPIRSDLYRIRGTSNTNLWAIGAGYALHKTRP